MKKCIFLFALLVITLLIAALTDETDRAVFSANDQIALEQNEGHDLLAGGETTKETQIVK
ncbi:hypothetical protein WIW50_05455 [Flavobacteriaceae bacterium 3-367]|uniref:hypothetical protein n=1 Tax=Eudoraea algarum TaxID=3417568 RepID=UPI00326B26FA